MRVHCPEGWWLADGEWTGLSVAALVAEAEPTEDAHYVSIASGPYSVSYRVDSLDRREAMIATAYEGERLEHGQGGPARLVFAHGACFEAIKWVERVTLTAEPLNTVREFVQERRALAAGLEPGTAA
jgi:DMSO/TMAO reductase YedYZ molybdopterin-dependent catalytic subunit